MTQATRSLLGIASLVVVIQAFAFDPITSAISKGVATAMDVRSKDEVKADVEIDATATKKLVDQKGDDLKSVSFLVFARHGVLVGFARNNEAKRKAEDLVKGDRRLRSLKNDVVVGAIRGGMIGNAVLDEKIGLTLTATKGISSVNMRWKVYGGDVFLMGFAQSKAEADLTIKTIKKLDGVQIIHSSLRIGKK